MDAADAVANGRCGDLDVAIITPRSAPRVSDIVVLQAVVGLTVANGSDSVVDILSALPGVDHATLVELENFLVGLNSHSDNGLSDGCL